MIRLFGAALAGVCLMAMSAPAAAQHPLFSENTELQVTIEGPLNTLVRRARRNTDPVAAIYTVGEERFEIGLEPRGVTRRVSNICNFPPLRLDFDGDAVRGTSMRGQNRLKLVTRCRAGASYEQLTVLEYIAYRLYNEVTPYSFRVRPLSVTYRDTDGRREEETQFNFVIEDVDDVARRNERLVALDVTSGQVRSAELNAAASARYGLFQLMIGNLDWDMVEGRPGEDCCHNSKLIAATQESRVDVIPVPYDFDFAGLVDAPYATPPQGIDLPNVRVRRYRGYCRHNDAVPAAAEEFRSRRAAIFAVIDNEARLRDNTRRTARAYVEEFFEILDNPQRFQRQVIDACRR